MPVQAYTCVIHNLFLTRVKYFISKCKMPYCFLLLPKGTSKTDPFILINQQTNMSFLSQVC